VTYILYIYYIYNIYMKTSIYIYRNKLVFCMRVTRGEGSREPAYYRLITNIIIIKHTLRSKCIIITALLILEFFFCCSCVNAYDCECTCVSTRPCPFLPFPHPQERDFPLRFHISQMHFIGIDT